LWRLAIPAPYPGAASRCFRECQEDSIVKYPNKGGFLGHWSLFSHQHEFRNPHPAFVGLVGIFYMKGIGMQRIPPQSSFPDLLKRQHPISPAGATSHSSPSKRPPIPLIPRSHSGDTGPGVFASLWNEYDIEAYLLSLSRSLAQGDPKGAETSVVFFHGSEDGARGNTHLDIARTRFMEDLPPAIDSSPRRRGRLQEPPGQYRSASCTFRYTRPHTLRALMPW